MTYQEKVIELAQNAIDIYGGLRKASKIIGINPGGLSKMANGKLTPRPNTLLKYFPDADLKNLTNTKDSSLVVVKQELVVNCNSLKELKRQLDILGYEIKIVRKTPSI